MYSGEDKGEFFPGNQVYSYGTYHPMGLDAKALYPDYWTDPAIKRCPSDAAGDFWGEAYLVEEDVSRADRHVAGELQHLRELRGHCFQRVVPADHPE